MNEAVNVAGRVDAKKLSLSPNWGSSIQVSMKTGIEFILSAAALLLLSPALVAIAIGIKLTSKGPVFYRCDWVGKSEEPFFGYKFRSMVANADELKQRLQARNEMSGPVFKITDDPRITRLGAWLRRHSLDEIPQLFNVLTGQLALVGPRPPLKIEYERYAEWQKQRLLVKPGITCLWQVSGRNEIYDFDEWVRLDFEYIENWSFWLDVKILVMTVREVLRGSGK